jgi:putative CocE/NonD family hydrolase
MTAYLLEHNVEVPMRDGVVLRMDVQRPADDGAYPVLLSRTPYGKGDPEAYIHCLQALEAGYAVVCQDTRGRYESDGDFAPTMTEAEDGFDTIEWIAQQSWCNGNVGMWGASYVGFTQIIAAVEAPPSLKAIVPVFASIEAHNHGFFQDGAFGLGWVLPTILYWYGADSVARHAGALRSERRSSAGFVGLPVANEAVNEAIMARQRALAHLDDAYSFLPLRDLPILREAPGTDYYLDWLANASAGPFWEPANATPRLSQASCAGLHIGGWFDTILNHTLTAYAQMRGEGTTPSQAAQRLLIGPWAHWPYFFTGDHEGFSFGPSAALAQHEMTALHLAYFDAHLRESDTEFSSAPVRIFVMGENVWRDEGEWPLARTEYVPWHLGAGGELSATAPDKHREPSTYTYDPTDPTPFADPSLPVPRPRDQRVLDARADILRFQSAALDRPTEVTGPLKVVLYVSTDVVDTDFVARLIDVHPDGSAWYLAEGILRMRYRSSLAEPEAVVPGEIYKIELDLMATSNLFLSGHRIRVDIASASFPRFDRNLNTGAELGTDSLRDAIPAHQTIYHDPEHPSHILLPLIPREDPIAADTPSTTWPDVSLGRDNWRGIISGVEGS